MAVTQVTTGPQDGLLKSSRTMVERCLQYTEITRTIPRFVELNNNVNSLIGRIDAAILAKQSSRYTASITTEKNTQTMTFLDELGDLADVVLDMAIEEKKSDWQAIAKRATRKQTKTISGEGQLATATEFLTFVRTIDPKILTHQGIDNSEIEGLEKQIEDIKALRLRQELTTDQKSLDNQSLASLFLELKIEKGKMMRLSKRFAKKAPAFFAALTKAAEIPLKTGGKATKTTKEKTPEQLAVIAAKKAVTDAKKAEAVAKKKEADAKKAVVKAQKIKEAANKSTHSLADNGLSNDSKTTAATN